jgi:hypothetical protein
MLVATSPTNLQHGMKLEKGPAARATPGEAARAVNIVDTPKKGTAIRLMSDLLCRSSRARTHLTVDRVDSAYRFGHLREGPLRGRPVYSGLDPL